MSSTQASGNVSSSVAPTSTLHVSAQSIRSSYLAPITTVSTSELSASFSYATNVSGITSAAHCWSALSSWYLESVSWYNGMVANTSYPLTNASRSTTYPWTSTISSYPTTNVSTYKLCDGSPRADISPLTQYHSGISTYWDTHLHAALSTSFRPQPCTPSPADCRLWYYYSTLFDPSANASVWDSSTNFTRTDNDEDHAQDDGLLTYCGFPAHFGGSCIIGGGPVQLFYFPVDTVGDDVCHDNASTITNTKTDVVSTLGLSLIHI